MSRSRDSRIKQAPRLAEAFQRLQAYEAQPREINVGSQGPREPRTNVYVKPFGLDLPADQLAQTSITADQYSTMAPIVNGAGTGAEVTDTLGTNDLAPVRGFTAAKVKWFRNATVSSTTVRSQRTNLPYLKYAGETLTCPFGRATETDNMYDVFNTLKSGILEISGFQMSRVSLTREMFSLHR